MNLLFLSDIHLPLGPQDPMRPELREKLKFLNSFGKGIVDRMEDRLREEAYYVQRHMYDWLAENDYQYDLIINGGDNCQPLNSHFHRMLATEKIWNDQLSRYGEDRFLALTGNHELGYGYNAEAASFPDMMSLRERMFERKINILGYGWEKYNNSTLLAIDSELIFLAKNHPDNTLINNHYYNMMLEISDACYQDGPVVIVTHNTRRVRSHLRSVGLLSKLKKNKRQVVMVGGHFHIPYSSSLYGIEELWSGGASYPEPFAHWLSNVPFTGMVPGGAGAIEINCYSENVEARHRPFGVIHKTLVKEVRRAA